MFTKLDERELVHLPTDYNIRKREQILYSKIKSRLCALRAYSKKKNKKQTRIRTIKTEIPLCRRPKFCFP
jgi:hypothetical protein